MVEIFSKKKKKKKKTKDVCLKFAIMVRYILAIGQMLRIVSQVRLLPGQ